MGAKQVTTSQKKLKVAINGFGRIGRNFLRCWYQRENSLLEVVVLNDSGAPSDLISAQGRPRARASRRLTRFLRWLQVVSSRHPTC